MGAPAKKQRDHWEGTPSVWPPTPPHRLVPFEETTGRWVRSQEVAAYLRRRASRYPDASALRNLLGELADLIEENRDLVREK